LNPLDLKNYVYICYILHRESPEILPLHPPKRRRKYKRKKIEREHLLISEKIQAKKENRSM
jgi:hypothetical protein